MKKSLLSLMMILAASVAMAKNFNLGEHGQLTMDSPATWKAEGHSVASGRGYTIQVTPKDSTVPMVEITVMFPPAEPVRDPKATEAEFTRLCGQFLREAVEKKVTVKHFQLKAGYGFYATFTDASLVGKPLIVGNFKTMSPGMLDLAPEVVVSVSILSDDDNGELFKQMIDMVQSITVDTKAQPPEPSK